MDKNTKNKAIIIVVLLIVALTYLLPTNKVIKYDYAVGHLWNKGLVVAPFDFPIYKTKAEFDSEKEGYINNFMPIYVVNNSVFQKIDEQIDDDFGILDFDSTNKTAFYISNQPQKIARVLKTCLLEEYNKGIIFVPENINVENHDVVRVLDNDELSMTLVKNLTTVQQVKNTLIEKLNSAIIDSISISQYDLDKYIRPNITYDDNLNLKMLDESLRKLSMTHGFVTEGTKIIDDGEVISSESAMLLKNLNKEFSTHETKNFSVLLPYLGNFLYLTLIIIISTFSMFLLFTKKTLKLNIVLFIATLYLMMAFLCSVVSQIPYISIYVIPFAVVPFYLSQFFNSRVAIIQYTFILLVCATFAPQPFEFVIFNLIAGVSGVYFLRRSYRRNSLFLALLATLLSYIVIYFAFTFMRQQEIYPSDLKMILWFVANVLILLAMVQLIFIFEKTFRFVTDITLVELCDTNQNLLKELSKKAPGTFQHSLQVANISEEAVKAIKGNVLLARAGALYHDIGKTMNPAFFVENVRSDENNHKDLTPIESARIISSHVVDGLTLARKYALPTVVSDFILTHHGDSVIQFFYHKAVEEAGKEELVDIHDFKYIGPSPFTKEQTICMIVDSVEAASRTLKTHDKDSLKQLVDSIVAKQQSLGQYRNSPLSFVEFETVKNVIITKLIDIYHHRVVYPK
ncbi:MAG: HDIG domain-containing protein [Bacteroidetes bacterium]|nr:HDIG domain-containing protein [Bacteroidota bacterium]